MRTRSQLILGSVGQRARSHRSVILVSARYLENHLSQAFIFHMVIALYEDMIPIDFGFSRLKFKVTGFKHFCILLFFFYL